MRSAFLVMAVMACSTSSKREDRGPMPEPNPATGSAVSAASRPTETPRVHLATASGEIAVNVEVVDTPAKIEKGLMYRQHLALDSGMLFLMGSERQWSFWMRNTLIPLDMIFIASDMTIAGIVENAQPLTETLRKVDKRSLYVLEVNGGWTRPNGVLPGARVRFENVTP